MALFTSIEAWYNPRRRHSALDYDSPMDFEAQHRQPPAKHHRVEHGLPTGGACVACATPPVDMSCTLYFALQGPMVSIET